LPIDKPKKVSTKRVDSSVDASTPAPADVDASTQVSTPSVDREKPIGKPDSDEKSEVSTLSTPSEGPQETTKEKDDGFEFSEVD
jgi:hypothetical protein